MLLRDRYRVVLIAGRGLGVQCELDRQPIVSAVGRSRQFVDRWVGRYRRGGIEALVPKRQPGAARHGAARRLNLEQEAELCAILEAGPPEAEGIAAYNGPILRERIERNGSDAVLVAELQNEKVKELKINLSSLTRKHEEDGLSLPVLKMSLRFD